jgi:hypothetical protein
VFVKRKNVFNSLVILLQILCNECLKQAHKIDVCLQPLGRYKVAFKQFDEFQFSRAEILVAIIENLKTYVEIEHCRLI